MKTKVQKMAAEWEADAIEKCRADPKLAAAEASGKFCITCMMDRPCLCDMNMATKEMRTYYETNRRNLFRREPVTIGSWGVKYDALMRGLYQIAKKHILRS